MSAGERRKLLYGVHGYGRGHAVRAQAILPELTRRFDVLLAAGDDAYDQLRGDYLVLRIPTLRYYSDKRSRRSAFLTLKRNAPAFLDLLWKGPGFQMVLSEMKRFAPDVVLSDSEPWTHRAGRFLGIPRISFDHYGVMAYCRMDMPAWDRLTSLVESLVYRFLVCKPERIIVTAFYEGQPRRDGVRVVGPVLRPEVCREDPSVGEYLLVYFSNGPRHFTERIEQALRALDCPVKVYGLERTGMEGNIEFRPIGNEPFLRDLAGARAVFATAGNQLISEAIHFRKPLLLMPEQSLEQRLNARYVRRWGIGMRTTSREVTAELLREFLARRDEFAENIGAHRSSGTQEAVAAIEDAVAELVPNPS